MSIILVSKNSINGIVIHKKKLFQDKRLEVIYVRECHIIIFYTTLDLHKLPELPKVAACVTKLNLF